MRKFVIAMAISASTLNAAITVYTTQASFEAAVDTTGIDTFENLDITSSTPSPITRTAGNFGYTAAVSTTSFFGAGSMADRWLSTDTATDTITFNAFTGGVTAFGGLFFGSSQAGLFVPGSVTLTATDASGTVTQTIVGATTLSFLGFVSTGPLLSATLSAVQPTTGETALWSTANNLQLASSSAGTPGAVPEPATWAMMMLGFGAMGFVMRRKNVSTRIRFA